MVDEAIELTKEHREQFTGLDTLLAVAKQAPEERSIAVVAR